MQAAIWATLPRLPSGGRLPEARSVQSSHERTPGSWQLCISQLAHQRSARSQLQLRCPAACPLGLICSGISWNSRLQRAYFYIGNAMAACRSEEECPLVRQQ